MCSHFLDGCPVVSGTKNKIVQACVLNYLVLNIHINAYLGLRGKPFFQTLKFFCFVCQLY